MAVKTRILSDLFRAHYHVTAVVPCGLNHQIYLERRAPLILSHRPEASNVET